MNFNVDFFRTNIYKFWSLHSTTTPEALSSFLNKNHGCDNGGNNNNL